YPERITTGVDPIDLTALGSLTFEKPDTVKFPLLKAAYTSLEDDLNCVPVILNAADEVATSLFLFGKIPFSGIAPIVMNALEKIEPIELRNLDEIEEFHEYVCRVVLEASL
ncbi:MAG: 1-deoxy-D-xylulose-5-phosphate reductoisomerase, partial [Syntrophaceae bacterium]|nr:1-deoxy-D-xylulose-5-phosphate reductoisomerase [Syntrophaceae bacterium]